MVRFRHLDLNLLRVLCAVYRLGSVTQAARHLALSQPATSNALARLRAFFDDALFVRSSSGLHPTRKAQRIVPALMAQLQSLETTVLSTEEFEPASSTVRWRLSLSDLGEMMFLPALAQAFRVEAPHSQLANVAVPSTQVSAALEAQDVHLAIGILNSAHISIASERLFQENFVAITASNWRPANGRTAANLTPRQLAAASLAVASPAATLHGSVDLMLNKLQLNDRIVLHARHYGALPELVTHSDLLAIVPLMYANSLAPRYDVRIWGLPDHGPRYDVSMVWHKSATDDPAHIWLRALVRRLFLRSPS
ncbi:MAG: LysR family transcriptional regulator [Comamonadaceae bacterium CG1_02_60_18]|nr:MAG: LysR family transcriptional regulator [Comamonadaceae bacterium CG1_02_60_18]PIQ56492.1 MAG: LysR family transcriptional regulator [Comamonadaceae bacterium CG12_big_fil_rev_8_21_14_0_65_59_15]